MVPEKYDVKKYRVCFQDSETHKVLGKCKIVDESGAFFRLISSMNNQRLHHTNSSIRDSKSITENMALKK